MPAQTPDQLAADMLRTLAEVAAGTQAAVMKGAQNIKTQARRNVVSSAPVHNAHAQYAITYDTDFDLRGGTFGAEIGYDKNLPGGALGNLLEYGSRKNAPHRDLGRALDEEGDRFEDVLQRMVAKLL